MLGGQGEAPPARVILLPFTNELSLIYMLSRSPDWTLQPKRLPGLGKETQIQQSPPQSGSSPLQSITFSGKESQNLGLHVLTALSRMGSRCWFCVLEGGCGSRAAVPLPTSHGTPAKAGSVEQKLQNLCPFKLLSRNSSLTISFAITKFLKLSGQMPQKSSNRRLLLCF